MSEAAEWLEKVERLARSLEDAPDEASRLDFAAQAAVELIRGCDHAGITVNEDGEPRTRAASDDVVRRANQLQYELGEGPCLDTLRRDETLVSVDLPNDPRWRGWAPKVYHELRVCSMLSVLIYTKTRSYGALSLYGNHSHAFDADDLAVAQVLAGHLAVAMAAGREIDHLGIAVVSRTIIGQAEGILMERFGVDADHAFDYLRRISMDTNRKLTDIATEIVETRALPTEST